jgi:hypothetical protein
VVRRVAASNSCTAVFTAQRNPRDGRVSWAVQLGDGCDRHDRAEMAAVDTALAETRRQLGC